MNFLRLKGGQWMIGVPSTRPKVYTAPRNRLKSAKIKTKKKELD